MKKAYKLMSIVLVAVMMICTLSTTLYALTPGEITPKPTDADKQIQNIGQQVLSAITTAGIVLSVVMLAVLGVKYMMGSAEEKAEYKKSMMPYLIGAVLIFGASVIATAVYNLAQLK